MAASLAASQRGKMHQKLIERGSNTPPFQFCVPPIFGKASVRVWERRREQSLRLCVRGTAGLLKSTSLVVHQSRLRLTDDTNLVKFDHRFICSRR
jgi:hypothetical protein